jgi:hypothetical protein
MGNFLMLTRPTQTSYKSRFHYFRLLRHNLFLFFVFFLSVPYIIFKFTKAINYMCTHCDMLPENQNIGFGYYRCIRYDKLANSAGYHEGNQVWLYRPTQTKGKSPKLQPSWDGPYKIVTRINDVVYRIQRNDRSKMMVVHLDQLAPYQGAARDRHP